MSSTGRCGALGWTLALAALAASACSARAGAGVGAAPREVGPPPVLAPAPALAARAAAHRFPKLGIMVQLCCAEPSTQRVFEQLPWWDLIVVDAETIVRLANELGERGRIRATNPNAILLAYISAGDVIEGTGLHLMNRYREGLQPAWFLRDVRGDRIPLFELEPGWWTFAVDRTTRAASDHLATFVARELMAPNLVDGIYYDWMATTISWLNHRPAPPTRIDLDGDGVPEDDGALDDAWQRGSRHLIERTRALLPEGTPVVGNAGWNTGPEMAPFLNGLMIEQFLEGEPHGRQFGWTAVMRTLVRQAAVGVEPRLSLVMANRDDGSDTAAMRFGLTSAMLADAYFTFTNRSVPSPAYQAVRWYDEYAVDLQSGEPRRHMRAKGYLGAAIGPAVDALTGERLTDALARDDAEPDARVWWRDFTHGRIVVNPSSAAHRVPLGRRFRAIRGRQDPDVNHGRSLDVVDLAPRSGVVLLTPHDPERSTAR